MSQIAFTIIFLAFIIAIFLAWYFSHKSRTNERLLLIEKELEIPESERGLKFSFRFPWLKVGILITAIATGFLIGSILSEMSDMRIVFEPLMMMLFGGIGMIIAHYADRKIN